MASAETLEHFVQTYGYLAIFIGTFLEGETILVIGGLMAKLGYLDLSMVMIIAFIGSFSGDQVSYIIGYWKGRELMQKYPRLQKRADKVHVIIERYHDFIMLGFRFVYGIRILTPFVIGLNKEISTKRFLFFNTTGAIIWSVIIAAGGYFFGATLEIFLEDIKHYQIEVILLTIIIGLGLWLLQQLRRKIKKNTLESDTETQKKEQK